MSNQINNAISTFHMDAKKHINNSSADDQTKILILDITKDIEKLAKAISNEID